MRPGGARLRRVLGAPVDVENRQLCEVELEERLRSVGFTSARVKWPCGATLP